MNPKEVIFGTEMQNRVRKGINIACDAVKSTIGPKGRNVFIDDAMQPKLTNDGVTIAKSIVLKDKFENMGAWLVKSTSGETNDAAGDGTTTTAVLLQAIIDEALKRPEASMDVMKDLKRVGARVVAEIKAASEPLKPEQIENVATISSESEEIGKMIANIIAEHGNETPFKVEDNRYPEISYEVKEGLELPYGYAHPIFITNQKEQLAEYEDVPVLVCERNIKSLNDIANIMKAVQQHGNQMVFLVNNFDDLILGQLVFAKMQGQFNALVVNVRSGMDLEDAASACGATLINEASGIKLGDITMEHLGRVQKITTTEHKTYVVNKTDKVKERADWLLVQAEHETNFYEKKSYKLRAERLRGGLAVIKVGAHTDTHRSYLKDKVDDAVAATRAAIEEGLVEGGGMCLYRIASGFKGNSIGECILREALRAPLRTIVANAGKDYATVVRKLKGTKGYNADTDKYEDLFKKGIVDPAKVTRCAFENALSAAEHFITAGVAMADLPVEEKKV